jgi:hypothetical protein
MSRRPGALRRSSIPLNVAETASADAEASSVNPASRPRVTPRNSTANEALAAAAKETPYANVSYRNCMAACQISANAFTFSFKDSPASSRGLQLPSSEHLVQAHPLHEDLLDVRHRDKDRRLLELEH